MSTHTLPTTKPSTKSSTLLYSSLYSTLYSSVFYTALTARRTPGMRAEAPAQAAGTRRAWLAAQQRPARSRVGSQGRAPSSAPAAHAAAQARAAAPWQRARGAPV